MRWFMAEMERDSQKRPEVPNEETIAAMKEVEEMAKHPERYEVFRSMDELMRALEEEE